MGDSDAESLERVCDAADVTEQSPAVVEFDGTKIAVFLADGEYFALDAVCPHQGGPLEDGKVEDGCVYCPWHGWQFDLQSGDHVHGKATATTYEVVVEGDDVLVGPTA